MPIKRRIMPASEDAVGMIHPLDGPLSRDGSDWTYDTFTHRRLHEGTVVFEEAEVSFVDPELAIAGPQITKPTKSVTTARPKITTR